VVDPSGIKVIKELVPEAKIVWVEGGAHTLRGHLREFAQENILEFLHEQGACKGCVVAASE
jgi:hypothetical protein